MNSENIWNFDTRVKILAASRAKFLDIAKMHGSPLYLYDSTETLLNFNRFNEAFLNAGVGVNIFYAIKTNYYAGLLKTIVQAGGNLDASSPREFELALAAGAQKIVYTGPGKTASTFELLLKHHDKVTIHLESIHELQTLAEISNKLNVTARCGIRINTGQHKSWSKFGIPIADLRFFWSEAKKHPSINLCGIHFHISHLFDPKRHIKVIREIGKYLKSQFTHSEHENIQFIDIGGGIYPEAFEGVYPWNSKQSSSNNPTDKIKNLILSDQIQPRYLKVEATPIEEYASILVKCIKQDILSLNNSIEIYAEPGRFIAFSTFHLLFQVVDIKDDNTIIVNAGNNLVGWEKYQCFDYAPIFNLSHYSSTIEKPVLVYGSLCTPDDLWGYYIYGNNLKIGDILLIAHCGDYTYSLAQNFIHPVAEVIDI